MLLLVIDGHLGLMLLLRSEVVLLLLLCEAVLHCLELVVMMLLHKIVLVQTRLLGLVKDWARRELHPRIRPPLALFYMVVR